MIFHKTALGSKFFNSDVPALIRALKKIGDELESSSQDTSYGRFEEITKEEHIELNKKIIEFDEFFNQLTENFKIDETTKINIYDLKALTRHVWNFLK